MSSDLFASGPPPAQGRAAAPAPRPAVPAPLADRLRPRTLDEVVGQDDLLGPGRPLRRLIEAGSVPSLILWGPPGCGKTTLARLMAARGGAHFLEYSAVAVGSRELKAVMAEAEKFRHATGRRTVIFLDEIHRFNKAQQDALLPWVERGDVTLIGATTENPSFEINAALLSRTRLFVLQRLCPEALLAILRRALTAPLGLAGRAPEFTDAALAMLAALSEGDARIALNLLETAAEAVLAGEGGEAGDGVGASGAAGAEAPANAVGAAAADAPTPMGAGPAPARPVVGPDLLADLIRKRALRYDKAGEEHFNLISALHKSLRNSDAQAGLYWLTRMLAAGEDPLYIARRLVRFASEDVGLADPQALAQALACRDAVQFIGQPEGELALAQAVVYLALSPKSNALYAAYGAAQREVRNGLNPPVPLHLRNAPTALMASLGYGADYVYAHDTADGIAAMDCLPETLRQRVFYRPTRRGFEARLAERLEKIAAWRAAHGGGAAGESAAPEHPPPEDPTGGHG